jgi:hypothetical protein
MAAAYFSRMCMRMRINLYVWQRMAAYAYVSRILEY